MQFPFASALLAYSHTFILEQKVDTISNFVIFKTCRSFAGAITLLAFLNGLAFPLSAGVPLWILSMEFPAWDLSATFLFYYCYFFFLFPFFFCPFFFPFFLKSERKSRCPQLLKTFWLIAKALIGLFAEDISDASNMTDNRSCYPFVIQFCCVKSGYGSLEKRGDSIWEEIQTHATVDTDFRPTWSSCSLLPRGWSRLCLRFRLLI